MSFAAVEEIARAVLYEGYLLYPYRTSALKNRQRWMFGRLVPRNYSLAHDPSEAWSMQSQCLLVGSPQTRLEISVRCLQLAPPCDEMSVSDRSYAEATEREMASSVSVEEITRGARRTDFAFGRPEDASAQGQRRSADRSLTNDQALIQGAVTLCADEAGDGLFKLTVVVENRTPCKNVSSLDEALFRSLVSTHTIARVHDGEFVSLTDPPAQWKAIAATCRNIGTWPVLVGPKPGQMILSAPIILSDYPRIAPESPGDLFDGTEIDELLTLRVHTLTDDEKRQMASAGQQARAVLERAESLSEQELARLHGRLRRESANGVASTELLPPNATALTLAPQPGDQVRLRPRQRADAFDSLLSGQMATIVSVDRDLEGRVYLGVVVEDDPGKDLGLAGQPAHRFYYRPDEVEPIESVQK